ncbi:MAG: hypothetical protein U0353_01650 [Sandaracinus sp.]
MIREAVLRSLGVVRVHPWVMLALGFALVLAVASTFTGLGLVLVPWFVCELIALALGASGVPLRPRGLAWVQAALMVLASGVLFGSVVILAALVFGPDLVTVDRGAVLPWDQSLLRMAGIVAISLVSLAYVLPFVHVPAILVERGGPFGTAVLESMLLVRRVGVLASFRLVLVAASFALLPAIVAAMVAARWIDRASTPLGVLASAPLLLFSLPVGLGVLAQGYLLARHLLPARHLVHRAKLAWTTLVFLALGVLAPVAGLVLLLVACALPAPLLHGAPPADAVELASFGEGEHLVPSSTLRLRVAPERVSVRPAIDDEDIVLSTPASRRGARPLTRVVVHAAGDLYVIELWSRARREGHALVTGSGLRVDDTVHRALDERMGVWRALVFGPTFLVIALLVIAALGPLAETRAQAPADEREVARVERRVHHIGLVLLPLAALVVALGALAVAGL